MKQVRSFIGSTRGQLVMMDNPVAENAVDTGVACWPGDEKNHPEVAHLWEEPSEAEEDANQTEITISKDDEGEFVFKGKWPKHAIFPQRLIDSNMVQVTEAGTIHVHIGDRTATYEVLDTATRNEMIGTLVSEGEVPKEGEKEPAATNDEYFKENPQFVEEDGKTKIVGDWPEKMAVAIDFAEKSDSVKVEDESLTISTDFQHAVYAITGTDDEKGMHLVDLIGIEEIEQKQSPEEENSGDEAKVDAATDKGEEATDNAKSEPETAESAPESEKPSSESEKPTEDAPEADADLAAELADLGGDDADSAEESSKAEPSSEEPSADEIAEKAAAEETAKAEGTDEGPTPILVDGKVPEDWESLHWKHKMQLAQEISGAVSENKDAAEKVIRDRIAAG